MEKGILSLENNDFLVEKEVSSRYALQSAFIFWFLVFYISMPNLEGPLRYYLTDLEIPWAIYVRDILVVMLGFWFIIKNCLIVDYNKIIYYFVCIMIFHSIIGLIYLPDFYMVLFGVKIFLPILIGLGSYYVFVKNLNKIKIMFMILFIISVAGIFINYFVEFPWEGFTYSIDIFTIEATRLEEFTFGIKRLMGFHRFASDAAIQIILINVFLIVHVNNKIYKIIIWALAGLAILLSTVKGIILSYLLISLLLIIQAADNKLIEHYKMYRKLYLVFMLIALLLPFISYCDIMYQDIQLPEYISNLLFTSFTSRTSEMWPQAIKIILSHGNFVLGRGLGGLGQSQVFFENYLFNPADNIFIYLYAQFGVLGVFYLIYFYIKSRSLNSNQELYLCLLALIIFQYGITQNIIESSSLCLYIGFLLAHINDQKLQKEYQIQLAKIKKQPRKSLLRL
jgi:hypothetical protein